MPSQAMLPEQVYTPSLSSGSALPFQETASSLGSIEPGTSEAGTLISVTEVPNCGISLLKITTTDRWDLLQGRSRRV